MAVAHWYMSSNMLWREKAQSSPHVLTGRRFYSQFKVWTVVTKKSISVKTLSLESPLPDQNETKILNRRNEFHTMIVSK